MSKIVLDDVKSLFEPIEVEFEGRAYRIKEPGLESWEEIEQLEAAVKSGAVGAFAAIRRQLVIFMGDEPFLGKLNRYQAERLLRGITESIVRPAEKEKNGPGPGAGA